MRGDIEQYKPSDWADLATRRVFHEIESLYHRFDQIDRAQWVDQACQLLAWLSRARRGLTMAEAYLLAVIQDKWDDLPIEFRQRYRNDFTVFVFQELGRRPKTWQADLRAVRLFLIERKGPSLSVDVPARDQYGNIVYENGRPKMESREWNPLECSLGKLKALVPFVADGRHIPSHVWGMVIDPYANKNDVQHALVDTSSEPSVSVVQPSSLRFSLQGPLLVAERNGEEVVVAELDYADYEESMLKQDAIRRLLTLLDIEDDADAILRLTHQAEIRRVYDRIDADD